MISFIGAGRVSKAVGRYFTESGLQVSGYYSINKEDSIEAARVTRSKVFNSLEEVIKNSSLVFLSVNDDSIIPLSQEIGKLKISDNKIIGHFSGALSSDLIKEFLPNNFGVFSMHPLQSFPGHKDDYKKLKKTLFTIEGQEIALDKVRSIFEIIGNKYIEIDCQNKTIYHAGSVIFSNYVTTLMQKGFEFFQAAGISFEDAGEMINPLILGSVENALKIKPENSLTGPISRGDYLTIEKHLESIENKLPESQKFYKLLAYESLNLAKKKLLKDQENINKIERILKEGK